MAKHNEIGKIGEQIAENWLRKNNFEIIGRNYLKKYGEIDIVARETTGIVHFVEVKTVSYETKSDIDRAISSKTWRPEENVHAAKQSRLSRTIQVWLSEHNYDGKWVIDIITIRVVSREKYAIIKFMQNVIFE
jgi:putative endonuclease